MSQSHIDWGHWNPKSTAQVNPAWGTHQGEYGKGDRFFPLVIGQKLSALSPKPVGRFVPLTYLTSGGTEEAETY